MSFLYSTSVRRFYDDPEFKGGSGYIRFQLLDRKTGETLTEIITNASGYGAWCYDERTGTYRQTRGTCQFSVPGTRQGLQKALRKQLAEELAFKLECCHDLSDAEQRAVEELGLNDETKAAETRLGFFR